jgi:hypothetical protein
MTKQGMRVVHLMLALMAIWFITPGVASAQVTVYHIKVTVSGVNSTASYCDSNGTVCDNPIWNLGTGVLVDGGKTLVLTQTGLIPGVGGNFDTSDRAKPSFPTTRDCEAPADGCTVTIELDTGSGLSTVYTDSAGNPLDNFNQDSGGLHFEYSDYGAPVFTAPNYTLQLGYADNAHVNPCPGGTCFPHIFDGNNGTTAADIFIGNPVSLGSATTACTDNCYDAGVLLITGLNVPSVCVIPPSQTIISNTSWNKFNAPAGSAVWIHAHIGRPSGISTSTITKVDFSNVTFVLNGITYALPDGHLVFDPAAPSTASTSFGATGWTTTLNPNNLSDEIFFVGDAVPIDANITGGGKANFSFTTTSTSSTLAFKWQWSAAVYTTWLGNNAANIAPVHASLHAGAPRNVTQQGYLIQGPRGGGGSNFTGSWSATGNGVCP